MPRGTRRPKFSLRAAQEAATAQREAARESTPWDVLAEIELAPEPMPGGYTGYLVHRFSGPCEANPCQWGCHLA